MVNLVYLYSEQRLDNLWLTLSICIQNNVWIIYG